MVATLGLPTRPAYSKSKCHASQPITDSTLTELLLSFGLGNVGSEGRHAAHALGHAAVYQRLWALEALAIVTKASPLREAPPTRKPSMSSLAASSVAFLSFTLPP